MSRGSLSWPRLQLHIHDPVLAGLADVVLDLHNGQVTST